LFVSLTADGRGVKFAQDGADQPAPGAAGGNSGCRKGGHPGQSCCARNAKRRSVGCANKEIVPEMRSYRHASTRSSGIQRLRVPHCNIRSSERRDNGYRAAN